MSDETGYPALIERRQAEGARMFEIRNPHLEPTSFDQYIPWAEKYAARFLKIHMDVVSFWVANNGSSISGGSSASDGNFGAGKRHLNYPLGYPRMT